MESEGGYFTLNNGNKIPTIALGTWQAGDDDIQTCLKEAINIGYRAIDTAPVYGNEAALGKALKANFESGSVCRDQMFITSKIWVDNHRAEDVRKTCLKSLEDLQLEYLDLLLIHWPWSGVLDFETGKLTLDPVPLSETWGAMEKLADEGLVKNIGLSNFNVQLILDLLSYCKIKPAINQVEMHPYHPQNELVQWCSSQGILMEAYCPLGLGSVPGVQGPDVQKIIEREDLKEIAKRLSKTPAQIILAWGIQRGTRILPKSSSAVRLRENFEAASIQLPQEDIEKINAITTRAMFYGGWKSQGLPIFS